MGARKIIIGSGITAATRTLHDGDDLEPAMKAARRERRRRRERGGDDYSVSVLDVVEISAAILRAAEIEGEASIEPDSPADFARRILQADAFARAAIAAGDAAAAARWGVRVGALAEQAGMKAVWEAHALRGMKTADAARAGAAARGAGSEAAKRREFIRGLPPGLRLKEISRRCEAAGFAAFSIDTIKNDKKILLKNG